MLTLGAQLALLLRDVPAGASLVRRARGPRRGSRWRDAAALVVEDRLVEAADVYAAMGSRPDEAATRLAAGRALVAKGCFADGQWELRRAAALARAMGAAGLAARAGPAAQATASS